MTQNIPGGSSPRTGPVEGWHRLPVRRVCPPVKWEFVDAVEFFRRGAGVPGGSGRPGSSGAAGLPFPVHRILLAVMQRKSPCIGHFVLRNFGKSRKNDRVRLATCCAIHGGSTVCAVPRISRSADTGSPFPSLRAISTIGRSPMPKMRRVGRASARIACRTLSCQ